MTSNLIQGLWIGDRLGLMERLSIRSFLHHGHEFHLYLYGPCTGVPEGSTVKDGRDILNREVSFYQRGYGKGSPAVFANLFRYELLFQRGGWWADLDVVALRPFRFDREHVLGATRGRSGRAHLNNAVIHAPPGSPLMARCLETARNIDVSRLRWGETGPKLLNQAADELGMDKDWEPPPVFYPVDAPDIRQFLRPGQPIPDAVGIHLWAQVWRHYGLNPNGRGPETSIYEQLIARYLPEAATEPRPAASVLAAILRSVPRQVSVGVSSWIRRIRRRQRLA